MQTELIRLQCYEGLDEARALYEWNYQKQLLRLQADEHQGMRWEDISEHLFSRDYLLERPLLKAISASRKVVLLIDEIDKADEEFEAFLLELLSDFQVTVPELGTLRAIEIPVVVLTSNRVRELSEALRRRCLHLFIDFPGVEQERRIVQLKVPGLDERLAAEAARFVGAVRKQGLKKPPSIAETLDWARALQRLGIKELNSDAIKATLGVLLKHEDDRAKVESKAGALSGRAQGSIERDDHASRRVAALRESASRCGGSHIDRRNSRRDECDRGGRAGARADARGARRHPHQGRRRSAHFR